MMVRKVLLLLLITLVSVAHCFEGEFTPTQSSIVEIEEGATFDAVIRIWPVSQGFDIGFFDKLKMGKINDNFFLVEKNKAKRSSYNADVVEVGGLFAVIKAVKANKKMKIKIEDTEIQLDIRRITTIATAPPPQNFEFVDQPEESFAKKNPVLVFAIPPLFILLLFIVLKLLAKRRKQIAALKLRQSLVNKIKAADDRSSIELVPSHLIALGLDNDLASIKEFVTYLESIQYKEKWSEIELDKISRLKQEVVRGHL